MSLFPADHASPSTPGRSVRSPIRKEMTMLRRALSLLLTACALCALLVPSSLAATIQSNQAVYHLSQDPDGTESFLYSPHPVPHLDAAASRHCRAQ